MVTILFVAHPLRNIRDGLGKDWRRAREATQESRDSGVWKTRLVQLALSLQRCLLGNHRSLPVRGSDHGPVRGV